MNSSNEGKSPHGADDKDAGEHERDADFSLLDQNAKTENDASPEMEELRTQLKKLERELSEEREKYLRALADLENFKKRSLKERGEFIRYQGEQVLYDLLGIIDDLERAMQHLDADPSQIKEGLDLIYRAFMAVMAKWEVKAVSGLGQEYDPSKFTALSNVPVDDAKPGTIINELKKAYFYKDKLLRPGQVVVAAAREENEGQVQESQSDNSRQENNKD